MCCTRCCPCSWCSPCHNGGLLAAPNQMALLERTDVGRDINRPYYDRDARAAALAQPVVKATLGLLRWRAANDDVFQGDFSCEPLDDRRLRLGWRSGDRRLDAEIDVVARTFVVRLDGTSISEPGGF